MRTSRRRRGPRKSLAAISSAAVILSAACIANALTAPVEAEVGQTYTAAAIQPEPAVLATAQQKPETAEAAQPEPAAEYYDVPLSHQLQDAVFREAERWNVPAALLLAMMDQESDYRTDLVSGTDDYGIMQINAINHPRLREELGVTDFLDPEQSITCGAYMIGELLDKFDGDIHRALTSYNRGEAGARRYAENNGTYESSYRTSIVEIYESLEEGRE